MQIKTFLICSDCQVRHANYTTTKQNKEQKLALKKYCKYCRNTKPHHEEVIKSSGKGKAKKK